MTGAQLVQRTQEQIGEIVQSTDPSVFYNTTETLAAINSVQRLFCLLTLCLETSGTLAVVNPNNFYRVLDTFTDWILPLRVRRADGVKVKPSTLTELDALDPDWQTSVGTPERYACLGFDLFAVYKKPTVSANLTVTYARGPVALTTGGTPEIPEEYHASLVDGAVPILRAKEGADELQKVIGRFGVFLAAATKHAAFVKQRNLSLRYDRVPFELERFDRSKLMQLAIKRPRAPMIEELATVAKG